MLYNSTKLIRYVNEATTAAKVKGYRVNAEKNRDETGVKACDEKIAALTAETKTAKAASQPPRVAKPRKPAPQPAYRGSFPQELATYLSSHDNVLKLSFSVPDGSGPAVNVTVGQNEKGLYVRDENADRYRTSLTTLRVAHGDKGGRAESWTRFTERDGTRTIAEIVGVDPADITASRRADWTPRATPEST